MTRKCQKTIAKRKQSPANCPNNPTQNRPGEIPGQENTLIRKQYEFIASAMERLLKDHVLVSCATKPDNRYPDVRPSQELISVTTSDHGILVNDSYGVVICDYWVIDPDKRAFHGSAVNGFGETLWFSWMYQDDKDIYGSYGVFRAAADEYGKIKP
jgi:hypothetical protein